MLRYASSLRHCGVRSKYASFLRIRVPCLWNFLGRRPIFNGLAAFSQAPQGWEVNDETWRVRTSPLI
jgi:hypothetical protein